MPGDLNLKKSWHSGLAKNRAKVQQREQDALEERRKIAERKKEIAREREDADMRAMQGLAPQSKLDWMYESKSGPDKDDYLLGKRKIEAEFSEKAAESRKAERSEKQDQRKLAADPMAVAARKRKPKVKKIIKDKPIQVEVSKRP